MSADAQSTQLQRAADTDILERPVSGLWRDTTRRLFKNKVATASLIYILVITVAAIAAPLITPYEFDKPDFAHTKEAPTLCFTDGCHWFGTDGLGRDQFTRIIQGGRVSLGVAFVSSLTALIIGVMYGAVAGYLGGWVDDVMMRFVDLMYGFPTLLFVILILLIVKPNAPNGVIMMAMFLALGIVSWLNVARLVRGQFLSLREREFVEAARAVGASPMRIIVRHLLPNSLGPVVVWLTLSIPGFILTEATLSFIGLGVKPPIPSWGQMLNDGWRAMRADPHLAIFPSLAISVTMLAFNFFGDGMRDALDPTMRGRE